MEAQAPITLWLFEVRAEEETLAALMARLALEARPAKVEITLKEPEEVPLPPMVRMAAVVAEAIPAMQGMGVPAPNGMLHTVPEAEAEAVPVLRVGQVEELVVPALFTAVAAGELEAIPLGQLRLELGGKESSF